MPIRCVVIVHSVILGASDPVSVSASRASPRTRRRGLGRQTTRRRRTADGSASVAGRRETRDALAQRLRLPRGPLELVFQSPSSALELDALALEQGHGSAQFLVASLVASRRRRWRRRRRDATAPPVAPASRSRSSSAVAARSLSERSAASLRPCSSLSSVTRRSNSISRMRLAPPSPRWPSARPRATGARRRRRFRSAPSPRAPRGPSPPTPPRARRGGHGRGEAREVVESAVRAVTAGSPSSTPKGTTDASFGENIRSSSASSASLAAKKSSSASTESARSSASRSSLASSALSTFSPDASASRTKPKRASVSVSFFEGASVTEEGLPPRLPRAKAFAATTNVARSASSFSAARARRARSASRRAKRSRFSPSNKSRFVRRRVRSSSRARAPAP